MRFSRLLVANRGEIAVRVIRACRALDIAPIAVYSEADARALHVLLADEAVCIGPPPAADSYLNIPALIDAARRTGAEAVHPGYGFLSENPHFAAACLAAGLVWVGPTPAAMGTMASKIAAKRLAADLGIPVLPGYHGDDQDDAALAAAAEPIGYPLLIKASAGGGGRGMRIVTDPGALPQALASARREARGAFGDDRLLLERYLARPRHVEIQVLGDHHGRIVHLGERECSVQRRHQKVIEESPSPGITPALREAMGAAAVRLAQAIGYTNAGTVEFIVPDPEQTGDGPGGDIPFAFLEMNTRLQVEHGVTELVTGLDLVQLQLRIAAGEPLPFRQDEVRARGHALQCRIYAEDPSRRYLPSSGRLTRFAPPNLAGVRNDVGVYEGFEVGPWYDPMLAKLLVWGSDRAEAIARAAAALDVYTIEGVATNLALLRATVRHPDFVAGRTHTALLDEQVVPRLAAETPPVQALLAAAAADLLAGQGAADPWTAGAWRQAGTGIVLRYRAGGAEHTVHGSRLPAGAWALEVNGDRHVVQIETAHGAVIVREDGRAWAFTVVTDGPSMRVTHGGRTHELLRVEPPSVTATGRAGPGQGGPRALTAPLAGIVARVAVQAGERVHARQPLVIIEAMKMEHTVTAVVDGVVRALHRAAGDRVQAGDVLVEVEPL
jgi:3-methylcrotonyl-CoA carboxylase alpha subunit